MEREKNDANAAIHQEASSTNAISAPRTNVITFNYPKSNLNSNCLNQSNSKNDDNSNSNSVPQNAKNRNKDTSQHLDFIGPSTAVKDLFALPYSSDVGVAIAVHNIGNGTLLIDGAVVHDADANINANEAAATGDQRKTAMHARRKRPRTRSRMNEKNSNTVNSSPQPNGMVSQENLLAYVSNMVKTQKKYLALTRKEELQSVVEGGTFPVPVLSHEVNSKDDTFTGRELRQKLKDLLPLAEEYTNDVVEDDDDPHFYKQWTFHKYNMLVGSNSIILKSGNDELGSDTNCESRLKEDSTNVEVGSNALSLRIVDADVLRSNLSQREQHKSYADVLGKNDEKAKEDVSQQQQIVTRSESAMIPYPDFARVSLRSCVLPSSDFHHKLHEHGFTAKPVDMRSMGAPSSSPVCMVLDAYMDNLIDNVPQLALCLQEKGLIQAVKLFETNELPTLTAMDLLTTNGSLGEVASIIPPKPLFSPELVESNAAMMLEFLKTNCSRENSTYLLKRNAGETSVQLLDVTSLSQRKNRKWIYWLAMMSMRFAMRLDGLVEGISDNEILGREYRQKKRSLLENALELFHELADMGGGKHETICCSLYEQLANSYLEIGDNGGNSNIRGLDSYECSFLRSGSSTMKAQRYQEVGGDGLSKASDLLKAGVKVLKFPLECAFDRAQNEDDEPLEIEAFAMQMYGLYHKLINVSLSLADGHLMKYRSSSVMQTLRMTARVLSDTSELYIRVTDRDKNGFFGQNDADVVRNISDQYSLLIGNCGNFARSFAADEAWRERGHACGEDVIALLRDVELLSKATDSVVNTCSSSNEEESMPCIVARTKGVVTLEYLSGILPLSNDGEVDLDLKSAVDASNKYLNSQKQLKREKRRVLVAASIKYSQAVSIFTSNIPDLTGKNRVLWSLMLQRMGDACNEIGKLLLDELRIVIGNNTNSIVVSPMLLSAEWWFKEGLKNFQYCEDACNIALIRCNLAQCCKIRSRVSSFRMLFPERQDSTNKNLDAHVELCLNDAARHLELAHETLDQRDPHNSKAWDMVSIELAATYLVLGVKRRQTLLGGGSKPIMLPACRLNLGAERSIVTPISRAKEIYNSFQIHEQVAAADYQLALYYTKIWTRQNGEIQTRHKLSKAFHHLGQAHKYYFSHPISNEDTLVCLILDLSALYSTTSGSYECQEKALLCCLDTCVAFSATAVKEARSRTLTSKDWCSKMSTLNDKMEERILTLLSSLVKVEKKDHMLVSKYENIYRDALRLKLTSKIQKITGKDRYRVFDILSLIKEMHSMRKSSHPALPETFG
eukprot:scaffold10558_cov241-Chaetoceros_neogracile.AAC.9